MRNSGYNILLFSFILIFSFGCRGNGERKKERQKQRSVKQKVELPAKEILKRAQRAENYFCKLQNDRSFNGVVLIATGNQIILKKAFGFKDFRTKEPLSIDSDFQLASVSKQFTAAAIMLLYQRGLLDYEDTVKKFFKDFPYSKITVRQLLTHKSGLSNYTYFCDKLCDRKNAITNQNVIRLMTTHKPKEYYPPGRTYDYSNTGYMLLAGIVEKVSHMKFEDFMLENIFKPAGMTNTYIYNHCTPLLNLTAVDGYNNRRRKVGKTYLDGVFGDKGVYSNVEDLYKWNIALYSNQIFKENIVEEAFSPAHKLKEGRDNYGFGWRLKNYSGDKVVWHGGWWEGYKTMFIRNLEDHTVIIVLANSLSGHLKANDLLDAIYNNP